MVISCRVLFHVALQTDKLDANQFGFWEGPVFDKVSTAILWKLKYNVLFNSSAVV